MKAISPMPISYHCFEEQICVCAQSCLTLWDPMDCSPSGSSVHGILQARRLEQFAIPFPRGSFRPTDQTWLSCISCTGRQSSLLLQYLRSKWGNRNELGKFSRWWGVDMGWTEWDVLQGSGSCPVHVNSFGRQCCFIKSNGRFHTSFKVQLIVNGASLQKKWEANLSQKRGTAG